MFVLDSRLERLDTRLFLCIATRYAVPGLRVYVDQNQVEAQLSDLRTTVFVS